MNSWWSVQSIRSKPAWWTSLITIRRPLHYARALAEQAQLRQSEGTAELHEVYRELFTGSSDWLRQEVGRITGLQMGAVTVADKAPTGAVVVLMTGGEPKRGTHS